MNQTTTAATVVIEMPRNKTKTIFVSDRGLPYLNLIPNIKEVTKKV